MNEELSIEESQRVKNTCIDHVFKKIQENLIKERERERDLTS